MTLKALSEKIDALGDLILFEYAGLSIAVFLTLVIGGTALVFGLVYWREQKHPCEVWTSERIEYVKGVRYRVRDCVERRP